MTELAITATTVKLSQTDVINDAYLNEPIIPGVYPGRILPQ